jgi:hypothetical protein
MGDWTARNEQRTIRIKEQQPPLGALLRWLGTMLFLPRIAHLFVSLSREKSTLNQRIAASHYESIIPTRDALKINSQGLLKKVSLHPLERSNLLSLGPANKNKYITRNYPRINWTYAICAGARFAFVE